MKDIEVLTKKLKKFRNDRDWKQFHTPKDMALSLVLEASEVLEHFQFKSEKEIEIYLSTHTEDVADELADVFSWVLLMSSDFNIDIVSAVEKKLEKNIQKYPVERVKGKNTKYTEL